MFYITGDKHGDYDSVQKFCYKNGTSKEDVLIVLGDAGINFYGDARDIMMKERLSHLPITLFCIQGNHDKRPEDISTYKTKKFMGAFVFYEDEYDNIFFAKDGEVYQFGASRCLVLGGAFSVDKYYRLFSLFYYGSGVDKSFEIALDIRKIMNKSNVTEDEKTYLNNLINKYQERIYCWNNEEIPKDKQKEIIAFIKDKNVDYVFSHTCPKDFIPQERLISSVNRALVSNSMEIFLQDVYNILKSSIKGWYCGHFHTKKDVGKIHFRYQEIEEFNNSTNKNMKGEYGA